MPDARLSDSGPSDTPRQRVSPGALPWLIGPAAAVIAVAALIALLPASGPAVRIRWSDEFADAARRQAMERRLHLVNPTHIEGVRWGYVLGDVSQSTLSLLASLPDANEVAFVERNPPRAGGPPIIRMLGPFAVQSFVSLVLGLLVLVGSRAPTAAWRRLHFLTACALFAVAWTACQLPIQASHEVGGWMGDYNTYTEDRAHFEDYVGYQVVRFHLHLGGFVLNLVDRALGATASSPQTAFLVTSWLAGAVFLLGAFVVSLLDGWTPRVMRYAGLAMAAPQTLFFFGFREFGYLALSVAAFPLLVLGLAAGDNGRTNMYLRASAVVQGLRSALHGFGLVGFGGSLTAALCSKGSLGSRVDRAATVAVWGLTAYLIWLVLYLIVLGLEVVPGHATGIPLRPVANPYVAESRLIAPLLSARGMRDVAAESVMVGVPLLVLGLLATRGSAEWRIAAAYSLPSLLFLVLFWPAQGIGMDADSVFAAFPAFFAGAWLCAQGGRAATLAFVLLTAGHAVFWLVVRNAEFLNIRA